LELNQVKIKNLHRSSITNSSYSDVLKDSKTTEMTPQIMPKPINLIDSRANNVSTAKIVPNMITKPKNTTISQSRKNASSVLINPSGVLPGIKNNRLIQISGPHNASHIIPLNTSTATLLPNSNQPSPILVPQNITLIPKVNNHTMLVNQSVGITSHKLLPELTFGGNAGGAACTFPFIYDGVTYYTCITVDRSKPWCSTTASYDKIPKWGYCVDASSQVVNITSQARYKVPVDLAHEGLFPSAFWKLRTYGGNGGGKNCVFPFVYDGQIHTQCIGKRDGTSWCAVTRSYDVHPVWGHCCNDQKCGKKKTLH